MKLSIEGMHCQACVRRVQKALEKVDGVQVESVDVGSAVVGAQPEQEQEVLEAVRKAGYQVHAT
jgi:copper chaperone CopZ